MVVRTCVAFLNRSSSMDVHYSLGQLWNVRIESTKKYQVMFYFIFRRALDGCTYSLRLVALLE